MNDQISLMMKICLMLSTTIISGLLDFTVLKQYVHHVGLLLHGQSFPKSESPTKILAFLEEVFHTEESKPDYICIDKACNVLKNSHQKWILGQSVEKDNKIYC